MIPLAFGPLYSSLARDQRAERNSLICFQSIPLLKQKQVGRCPSSRQKNLALVHFCHILNDPRFPSRRAVLPRHENSAEPAGSPGKAQEPLEI
jgi:hypothetical protein